MLMETEICYLNTLMFPSVLMCTLFLPLQKPNVCVYFVSIFLPRQNVDPDDQHRKEKTRFKLHVYVDM